MSGTSGTTVIQGSRWGVGNSIQVENNGSHVVIDDGGVRVNGVPVTGAAKRFWSKRVWSEKCGAYLYRSPKAKGWYRFDRDDRAYYPVEVYPDDECRRATVMESVAGGGRVPSGRHGRFAGQQDFSPLRATRMPSRA